jgi:CheY-like chemotaxis protein
VPAGWSASLIVLDLMMPVMHGWAFHQTQLASDAWRDIPVVVVTANDRWGIATLISHRQPCYRNHLSSRSWWRRCDPF